MTSQITRQAQQYEWKHDALFTIQAMSYQEARYAAPQDHTCPSREDALFNPQEYDYDPASEPDSGNIEPECRAILCEWAYRVVDHFGIGREVVAYAMSYVDRFCSKYNSPASGLLNRGAYTLVTNTALYLSLKLHHEGERERCDETQELHICDLASWGSLASMLPYLTHGEHTHDHLVKCETALLQSLGFYVHPPLPTCFVEQFVILLQPHFASTDQVFKQVLLRQANVFVHLSVLEYSLVSVRPSLIALAAILNALGVIGNADQGREEALTRALQGVLITYLGSKGDGEGHMLCSCNDMTDVQGIQTLLWEVHVAQFGENKAEAVLPSISPRSTTQFTTVSQTTHLINRDTILP
jgi:hypothetical protein